MVRIAVTGNVASGKSRVAQHLQARGVPVCDADLIAHDVMAPGGAAYEGVVAAFGRDILTPDGCIDRRELSDIVLADDLLMQRLNRLVHPVVRKAIDCWLDAQAAQGKPLIAVIVPLLFEAHMEKGWDAVVCVGCSPDVRRLRLKARGFDDDECERRVAVQMGQDEKIARSDYLIWNDESEAALEQRIDDVLKSIEEREQ
ncbi:MAG: dephospho-CoA kinase [Verrucomicrobia bacterium]|jgi:dephospho-CoA kinase|nr:dephospho-CoA kinase [Verrucomicrobiota bacterium]